MRKEGERKERETLFFETGEVDIFKVFVFKREKKERELEKNLISEIGSWSCKIFFFKIFSTPLFSTLETFCLGGKILGTWSSVEREKKISKTVWQKHKIIWWFLGWLHWWQTLSDPFNLFFWWHVQSLQKEKEDTNTNELHKKECGVPFAEKKIIEVSFFFCVCRFLRSLNSLFFVATILCSIFAKKLL